MRVTAFSSLYNELYACSYTELIFMDFIAMDVIVKMLQICF